MKVVFTDLDGTLLDEATYSFEAAAPALGEIRAAGIPLVLVTSKTRAETEWWRERIGSGAPYVVENGGAALIPDGCFSFRVPARLEFGTPYAQLTRALAEASASSGCRVRGFSGMTTAEVAEVCGLPAEQAALARLREYDEPFVILDPEREKELLAAIEGHGLRWTRGGRFHHILGGGDKAQAVAALLELYRREFGRVHAIGLGDAWNDIGFLRLMDSAVVIDSPAADRMMAELPGARRTALRGPAGWSDALVGEFGLLSAGK
jgi:mannosyl-3-phosphoglycerate phosphatase